MAEVTYDSATCIYPGAERPAVDALQPTAQRMREEARRPREATRIINRKAVRRSVDRRRGRARSHGKRRADSRHAGRIRRFVERHVDGAVVAIP